MKRDGKKTFDFVSSSLKRSADKGEKNEVVQCDFYCSDFFFLIFNVVQSVHIRKQMKKVRQKEY